MNKLYLFILFIFFALPALAKGGNDGIAQDTSEVIKLNSQGLKIRLTDPDQTIANGIKALALAKKLGYKAGIGESYRVIGIGKYYLGQFVKAIDDYQSALDIFNATNDLDGQGRVYNNIGNLYRNTDYDLSSDYFNRALVLAHKVSDTKLTANIYLNLGTVYYHKSSFYQALNYYNKSNDLFAALKDTANLIQCMENKGVIYYSLNQYDKAEALLLQANQGAKKTDLNEVIATTDLTLADLYIAQNKFNNAENTINEGITYANIIKNEKTESDFKYTSYQLEVKRKNFERATKVLYDLYKTDSVAIKNNTSSQIAFIQEQANKQAQARNFEALQQRQQYDRVKFWAVAIVAGLLLFLVAVLINNVKRKAKTNLQLTTLNAEVSRQKDNLDRINHHLEEIIDERTKDLQVKNKKLSEYSSYLSHQIRGPIATLKGLMNLEKEGLVDQPECIRMMNKCVGEIDEKIIDMSDMLHDPGRTGF
jgi:tetratricopeptide (TPR) repeat protein